MSGTPEDPRLPVLPEGELRAAVAGAAAQLDACDRSEAAGALRAALASWTTAHRAWTEEVARVLGVHHDINNALVGVKGNAQLLMLGPAGQVAGARDRLEVVLRESDRIRLAGQRIHQLKLLLTTVAHESESTSQTRVA